MYKVRAEVIKMNGRCTYHKVGDYIEAEDDLLTIPDGRKVCLWSLSALLPFLTAVQREHDEPDDWLSAVDHIQCPDSSVEVLWEIKEDPRLSPRINHLWGLNPQENIKRKNTRVATC